MEHEPDASKNCSIVATVLCDALCSIVNSTSNVLLPSSKPPIILGRDKMTINGPSKDADDNDDDDDGGSWSPVKVIATFGEEDLNTSSKLSTNVRVETVVAPRLGRSKNRTVSFLSVARRVYVPFASFSMEQMYPSWTPNAPDADVAAVV